MQRHSSFTGLGFISARGGNVISNATGAGSGGRISINAGDYNFRGDVTATGGSGVHSNNYGGPGTIFRFEKCSI